MFAYSSVTAIAGLVAAGVFLFAVGLAGAAIGNAGRSAWIRGALTVALTGYAVFWAGFFHPAFGCALSWVAVTIAVGAVAWRRTVVWAILRDHWHIVSLMALVALFYGALLNLYPMASWSMAARTRFLEMPGDNEIPRIFADIIRSGDPTRILGGDWLTSDRPPLQTGVALLVLPLLNAIGFDLDTSCAAAGVWLQLLWIPAVDLLLRRLGLSTSRATAAVAMFAFTGFLMFNSIYLWPKLAAAAFVLIAVIEWFLPASEPASARTRFARGGACAACGWLLHGGVMFALAALTPFVFATWRQWRGWLCSAALFAAIAVPWLAYQREYAPPGNRLLKWHIAGDIGPDDLTFSQVLRQRYAAVGWKGAWDARRQNAQMLFSGNWAGLKAFYRPASAPDRKQNETFFPLRTGACWWAALVKLPFAVFRLASGRTKAPTIPRAHGFALGWWLLTLLTWIGLMFFPNQVFTHQGSYTTQLLLLALLASWAMLAHPLAFVVVALVEAIDFFATWAPPNPTVATSLNFAMLVLAIVTAAGVIVLAAWSLRTESSGDGTPIVGQTAFAGDAHAH